MDTNPAHVEPSMIPFIKEISTGKSDGDYVKLKLCRDPKSSTSDIYEFRISLFDYDKPEEFLLSVWDFKMTLVATGTLEIDVKVQYLFTLVRGEVLRQFDLLSDDMENTDTSLTVDYLLKGLAWYFSPVNSLSKQMRAVRHCMKKHAA